MGRYVSCAHAPFASALFGEAVKCAAADVILGIGDEYVSCLGMYGYTIGYGYLFLGAVGNEICRNGLFCANVYYAV